VGFRIVASFSNVRKRLGFLLTVEDRRAILSPQFWLVVHWLNPIVHGFSALKIHTKKAPAFRKRFPEALSLMV
jgi:hypothetical protein